MSYEINYLIGELDFTSVGRTLDMKVLKMEIGRLKISTICLSEKTRKCKHKEESERENWKSSLEEIVGSKDPQLNNLC